MATGKRGWNLRDPEWRKSHSPRGDKHYAWKGDGVTPSEGRQRARALYPDLGTCQRCQRVPAIERHHVDGDTINNAPENVRHLCRRCHMAEDGRLEAFQRAGAAATRRDPKPCGRCSKPYKPLRRGLCAACDARARRNGER